MNIEEILGRREEQRLEFKSADVLANELESVARAVIGMLNAEAGEIWIGVDEEDEVAVAINPVANPERAKRRLWDYLVETMDPAPLPGEVVIDLEPIQQDRAVMVIRTQPPEPASPRLPFAFRRKGGWHFIRRIGARNHPMTREEIFGRADRTVSSPVGSAIQELLTARQEFRDSGESGLRLAMRPAKMLDLDVQDDLLRRIATDPSTTGNRRTGYQFANSSTPPQLGKDGVQWQLSFPDWEGVVSSVTILNDGNARFHATLQRLDRTGDRTIYPIALLEYIISAFRIMRVVYLDHLKSTDNVAADLSLFGVPGWGIPERSPEDFRPPSTVARQDETDLIWEPLVFTFRDIDETPDRCGFRLVRRVYQAFGLPETAIPRHYDRETGRLLLPE